MPSKIWRNLRQNKELFNEAARSGAFIVFDTETTGLKKDDEIIEISCLKCSYRDGEFKIDDQLHEYIRPTKLMEQESIDVHHITNEFLADKKNAQEIFPEIDAFFGPNPVLGAYNSGFDIRMLRHFYAQNNRELNLRLEIDLLKIAKDILCEEQMKDHKLATVANYYGVDVQAEKDWLKTHEKSVYHSADYDTYVLYMLTNAMLKDLQENGADTSYRPLRNLTVYKLNYWPGFRGNARLYVITSGGSIYYDMRKDKWMSNTESLDLSTVNMKDFEMQVFEKASLADEWNLAAGTIDYKELARVCRTGAFDDDRKAFG